MMKVSRFLGVLTVAGLTLGLSSAQAAQKAENALCLQFDQEAFVNCLNEVVVPDQLAKSQAEFAGIAGRLAQGFDLSPIVIQRSFVDSYSAKNEIPAIEVGRPNFETENEEFSPSLIFRKTTAGYVENNIRRAMNFAAWYHARSFGRTSSMLFSFRRLEIQADLGQSMGMALKDRTLVVTVPQERLITEKELIEFWNSGRVHVPANVSGLPMSWIQFLAKFGDQGVLGQKVLEYWKFLNPVGEFRVGLHALYLSRVVEAKSLIEKEDLSAEQKARMVSFLENPIETAKSLDSLFTLENVGSNKGVVAVNRTTGFCLIKVSNSHVINVGVNVSRFHGPAATPSPMTVRTENGTTVVEADSSKPVHIVNDKTYAGLVCVDTHDNVDVSLDVVFGQLEQQLSPETLVNYAKSFAL